MQTIFSRSENTLKNQKKWDDLTYRKPLIELFAIALIILIGIVFFLSIQFGYFLSIQFGYKNFTSEWDKFCQSKGLETGILGNPDAHIPYDGNTMIIYPNNNTIYCWNTYLLCKPGNTNYDCIVKHEKVTAFPISEYYTERRE